jgi:hypothetical protein
MCRWLVYYGKLIPMDEVLYGPQHSLSSEIQRNWANTTSSGDIKARPQAKADRMPTRVLPQNSFGWPPKRRFSDSVLADLQDF